MLDESDLLYTYNARLVEYSAAQSRMRDINEIINGDKDVPLSELGAKVKAAIPNIPRSGLEAQAIRIASTVPDVIFPALKPNIEASIADARFRREVLKDWHTENQLGLKLRKLARWLKGYGSAPLLAMPNPDGDYPLMDLRSPLNTYPSITPSGSNITPDSAIFTYAQRYDTLVAQFPSVMGMIKKPRDVAGNTTFQLLEYIDAEQYCLAILSNDSLSTTDLSNLNQFGTDPSKRMKTQGGLSGTHDIAFLKPPTPNTAGICWAVIPGLISLDRVQGAFDNVVGMYENMARKMALEDIAIERSVLPEIWIEQNAGEVVDYDAADARKGKVGVVKGGRIQVFRPDPSSLSLQSMDRIERAMRIDTGTPPQLGGEATTNVRTGRLNDSLVGAAIDFDIQEAQEILAEAIHQWDIRAIAIQKATKRGKTISFSPPSRGVSVPKSYVPTDLFDSPAATKHLVRYAVAGTDLANLAIGGLQRVGAYELSHRSFMENDPWVIDPEYETNQIIYEQLIQATLSSIEQQVASGQFPVTSLVSLIQKFQGNKDLIVAFGEVQAELQQLQASQAPPTDPSLAQPGVNAPTAGGQAQPSPDNSPIAAAPPGLSNLLSTLTASRLAQRTAPGEGVLPAGRGAA